MINLSWYSKDHNKGSLRVLKIFKLNMYHTVNLMFRVKNIIPEALRTKFQIVQQRLRDKTQRK